MMLPEIAALPGSLPAWLPVTSFLLSAFALVRVAVLRQRQGREAERESLASGQSASRLEADFEGIERELKALGAELEKLQTGLRRPPAQRTAAPAARNADPSVDEPIPVDPRITAFIDLVRAWRDETRHALSGAAARDWTALDALTVPGARMPKSDEQATKFLVYAQPLVDYAVKASALKVRAAVDEPRVGKLLGEMARLVGWELIDPQPGQRVDSKLHESRGIEPAAGQQRGTIAEVKVRGLIRANGTVTRAHVILYD